uniref:Uncharacterized protein MANES_13G058400 n=1 Tax=Rhizophora mucronata TaxID=61149 RepID=A0A2P2MDG1_RHIMU
MNLHNGLYGGVLLSSARVSCFDVFIIYTLIICLHFSSVCLSVSMIVLVSIAQGACA